MSPALRPILRAFALVFIGLAITACSSPGPSLTSGQTAQALAQGQEEGQATADSFNQQSEAGNALTEVSSIWEVVSLAVYGPRNWDSEFGTLSHGQPGDLDRHVYEWDPATSSWTQSGNSTNLEYHWEYGEGPKQAAFVVDWDAHKQTIRVNGDTKEVPQGLRATLTADAATLGEADANMGYFSSSTCGTTDEVTSYSADGYLGTGGDQLTFETTYSLDETGDPDVLSSAGDFDLVSGGKQTGFDWNLKVYGSVTRSDCGPGTLTPTHGNASASVYAGDNSASFSTRFDNIEPEGTFDIDGSFSINGRLALTFAGNYNDSDGDGVWGHQVVLTFAGNETMTLEQVFNGEFGMAAKALTVLNVLR